MGQQEGPIEKHHFRDTRVYPQEIKRRLMRSSCYYHVPIARASASSMSKNILRGFHSDDEQRKCERYRQSMNAINRCCKSQGSGLSRGAWRCRNLLSFIEFAPCDGEVRTTMIRFVFFTQEYELRRNNSSSNDKT